MIELQEREEQATQEEKLNAERDAHNKLMGQANLEGVESLIDDMVGGETGKACSGRLGLAGPRRNESVRQVWGSLVLGWGGGGPFKATPRAWCTGNGVRGPCFGRGAGQPGGRGVAHRRHGEHWTNG